MWRKNRRLNEGSTCRGVDLNRNFDVNFGGVGTSGSPCGETYRGPSALSEKESSSLARFIDRFPNTTLYLSFHSYGQYLMFPYVRHMGALLWIIDTFSCFFDGQGHTEARPPNFEHLVSCIYSLHGPNVKRGAANILWLRRHITEHLSVVWSTFL